MEPVVPKRSRLRRTCRLRSACRRRFRLEIDVGGIRGEIQHSPSSGIDAGSDQAANQNIPCHRDPATSRHLVGDCNCSISVSGSRKI